MTALSPDPTVLELHSPALGPWFSVNTTNLPLPATGELAIDLTLNNVAWQPPASGFLSFFVVTDPRPPALRSLRNAAGTPAFADGSFVALFRLLSWVERRIDALSASIPSVAPNPLGGVSTRPIVRSLALELTTPPTDVAGIEALLATSFEFPSGMTTDADKAGHLGLSWDGATLGNSLEPMSDLFQPGDLPLIVQQQILQFSAATPVRLWSFDHRGRPLDAGAVAAWWNYLATVSFTGLWADGLSNANQRTAAVAAGRTVHLVNPHEGPLTVPIERLNIGGATGAGVVRTATGNAAVTVNFTNAPLANNDVPTPIAAVLPDGAYGQEGVLPPTAAARAWVGGPIANLARDFARVGIASVEQLLVGQQRVRPDGADPQSPAARRADDQDRNSTGVRPARSMRGALLNGGEAVLGSVTATLGGAGAGTLIASVADLDAGPVAFAPAGALPASPPTLTAQALDGGGTLDGAVALAQHVLLTVIVGAASQGAWVRAWPLGFDHDRGEHIRMDGGGAPVDATGIARMVVRLPDGTVDADPPLVGVDLLVVTAATQRVFPDIRVARPFPAGAESPVGAGTAVAPFLVDATGAILNPTIPPGAVPPGANVVALGGSQPALIDHTTLATADFAVATVINSLTASESVELTEPAFQTPPGSEYLVGATAGDVGTTGATVNRQTRAPFTNGTLWQAGFPLPGMERLEVLATDPTAGTATVGATALLRGYHELAFHHQGHPGCPGAPDVHGDGVFVNGSAAVPFAEYTRDRVTKSTAALAQVAQVPIPDPGVPAANSLWIAMLRTEAAGVAAEIPLDLILGAVGDPYPFGGVWEDVIDALGVLLGAVPPVVTPVGAALVSAQRALDRRILTAAHGAREGATAMAAAIERAEDFVYIETPALDHLPFGHPEDELSLWQTLLDRMDANPTLHVAVCVSQRLLPGTPDALQRVRDRELTAALNAAAEGSRGDRFVAFSPAAGPSRALHLASTTVVVDDVVAIVGTTHLWRRGLSFDSSLAAAVFDEAQARGRSVEVTNYRTTAMANQLGIPPAQVPLDAADAIRAIREMVERGGFGRLAPERIAPPDPTITTVDPVTGAGFDEADVWLPDGSFPDLDPFGWLVALGTGMYGTVFNPPPP